MTPEQKLEALFASQKPAENDYGFEIAVLERIAKARAVNRFSNMAMAALAGSGLLAAIVWMFIAGEVAAVVPIGAAVAAMGLAGLVIWSHARAGSA